MREIWILEDNGPQRTSLADLLVSCLPEHSMPPVIRTASNLAELCSFTTVYRDPVVVTDLVLSDRDQGLDTLHMLKDTLGAGIQIVVYSGADVRSASGTTCRNVVAWFEKGPTNPLDLVAFVFELASRED